jgi:hypothetical protein
VIGDRADAADGAFPGKTAQPCRNLVFVDANHTGDRPVRRRSKGKPGLRGGDDLTVDGIEHRHTSTRKPT